MSALWAKKVLSRKRRNVYQHFCAMKNRDGPTFFLPPLGTGLPLFWTGMGEESRATPDYRWHGLRRDSQPRLLWQLTLRGEGTVEIGSHPPLPLRRGHGFLARIPSDHCYYHRPGAPAWRFVWLMWSGPAIRAIADALLGHEPVRLMRMDPAGADMRALRSLVRLGADPAGDPWRNSVEAYRLLMKVCHASSSRSVRPTRSVRDGSQAEKLLKREPGSPIGKEGLAARLGLSRFQLYRTLKQRLGISPHEWAARQRVIRACRLLKVTQHSVADIARKTGFSDANYFARFFRLRTGFSPRDWRKLFAGEV
jgi:AraC-like DNA-binding protein